MIELNEILNNEEKKRVTEKILRDLPEWFGIESSIIEYIEDVQKHLVIIAKENETIIGLIAINYNNKITAEVFLIGVIKSYHRKGIGKLLINKSIEIMKRNDFKYLMVKTLGETHPDKNYAMTRSFYKKMNFLPVQEINEIWGKDNPCLIMLRNI